jgi:uncharacterized protein (DUF58 family)
MAARVPQSKLRRILTADYFPGAGRLARRWFWNPAGALLLAAAVALLCGLVLSTYALVLAAGLVGLVVIGLLSPWLALRGVESRIGFDRSRCREGESVSTTLRLTRRWSRSPLALRGGFESTAESSSVVMEVPASRGRTVLATWRFTPSRRGCYPLASPGPRLVTGYPFGLREASRPVVTDGRLIVWPRVLPVGTIPDSAGDTQFEGRLSHTKSGSVGDVLGVRPYRRGDPIRRIHWSQTAKHDRLMVCELQSHARPRVQIVLDSDPKIHVGRGADSSREWAIRITASLAEGWSGQGADVEVVIAGTGHRIDGVQALHRMLDALATLPDAAGPPLADVLAAAHFGGLQVVVTTDLTGADVQGSTNRRFFILESAGFMADDSPMPPKSGLRPWVRVASPSQVASALRSGWKEAGRGSD